MHKFYTFIVEHRKAVLTLFSVLAILGIFGKLAIKVDYNISDYLPDDAPSTIALNKMEEEFDGGIANARAMVQNVTIPEALEYKQKIADVNGVSSVTWLDDSVDITTPLETIDQDTLETYYKDNAALFSIVIEEDAYVDAVADIRAIIGEDNALSGTAVNTADGTTNTVAEIIIITAVAIVFVFLVLLISTDSWLEPVVVLLGLGVAILINDGSNIIFGTISFVTNSAGSVLQLAVSLDYSVFLIHRFEEMRKKYKDPKQAMIKALDKSTASILSSGLTTVIGFLAIILMRFKIGPDVGLALAKGVAISLITTFTFMPALVLATHKWLEKTRHKAILPSFKPFGKFVSKVTRPLSIVFVLVAIPATLAYFSNSYYFGSSHLYAEGTRIGRDTAAITEKFGESDMYALLVPRGSSADEASLAQEIKALPEVSSVLSYSETVGNPIPYSYLDEATLSQLESDNYSRIVINVKVPLEGEETFALVETIRGLAQKYYGEYYLAGEGVTVYDLKDTITADMNKVNFVAIGAVFVVLSIMLKDLILPLLLVICIEVAIAINLSFPYFAGDIVFYVAYLIISSIQLGATVDYAILMSDHYKENRKKLDKKQALIETVGSVTSSIIVSGGVLAMVGHLMGWVSSNQLLAQLGIFIGRGAILSLIIVVFVLPGILYAFDKLVIKQGKATNEK